MIIYMYSVTVFSLAMTFFKFGHIKGSKAEKYNIGEVLTTLPFLIQLIAGVILIINNTKIGN